MQRCGSAEKPEFLSLCIFSSLRFGVEPIMGGVV
jgi:hypothetical protein